MKSENLTAWALNELSADEQAKLEAELQADPAAQEAAKSNKEFCGFLSRELRDDSMALTPEQRALLIKAPAPKVLSAASAFEPRPLRWWQRPAIPMAAAAGIVVGGLLTTLYMLPMMEKRAQDAVAAANKQSSREVRVAMEPSKPVKTGKGIPANVGLPPSSVASADKDKKIEALLAAAGKARLGNLGTGDEAPPLPIRTDLDKQILDPNGSHNPLLGPPSIAQQIASLNAADAPDNLLGGRFSWLKNGQTGDFDYSELDVSANLTYGQGFAKFHEAAAITGADELGSVSVGSVGSPVPASPPVALIAGNGNVTHYGATAGVAGLGDTSVGAVNTYTGRTTTVPALTPGLALSGSGQFQTVGGVTKSGAGSMVLNGGNTYTGGNVVVSGGLVVSNPVPAAAADGFVSLDGDHSARRLGKTEDYKTIVENPLTSVAREPLSTFSTDVDTASYANVRRFLNQNTKPPRDAVRIEELINYFPSSEPAPAADAKQPFAVTVEMAACPWQPQHRLTRINLKGRDIPVGDKPSNLVFLVDVSGSMDHPEKLPLVQRSLRMLTERLGENDHVAMVTYAGGTRVVLPSTNGVKKADIIAAIDELKAGGSTHGSAGIQLAYEQAVSGFIKGGVNRVILCTDGDFNVGISDPKELEGFITEKARSGVFLSVLGFGTGNLKDRTMQTLADKGNGNHAYIDSVSEARKVLVEQMQGTLVTIAKDVKIQVEFNPAVVREYRLIGYEKRLLAKEDFNDDTKDAGEIGAGHSVTALYELVPANLPPGTAPAPLVDKLKYQTTPEPVQLAAPAPVKTLNAASNEALTVKLRYKEPEGTTSKLIEVPVNDNVRALEKASAEFKFTAAVAGFGMLMRESSYTGALTWDIVRTLAREGKGSDALGYRGEFLQLIEKAASGK